MRTYKYGMKPLQSRSAVRILLAALFVACSAGTLPGQEKKGEKLAPYFPTPLSVVDRMLKLADVKPTDTVYDLGSGDGRIVVMAAEKFGAKAVGVEYDDSLVMQSRATIKRKKLDDKATIIHGDMLVQDYSPATVVMVYLLPSSNEKMQPLLEKQLKPGTRVVCHDFEIPGWSSEKTITIDDDGEGRSHTLFLYRKK